MANIVKLLPHISEFTGKSKILPQSKYVVVTELGSSGYNTGLSKKEIDELVKLNVLPEDTAKFFAEYQINLTGDMRIFDLDKLKDKLDYNILLTSPAIAKNKDSINQHTMFYFFNDEEEASKDTTKHRTKVKAFNYLDQMSPDEQRKILILFGKQSALMNNDQVYNNLIQVIENNASKFVSTFEDKAKLHRITLAQMVQIGIVKKSVNGFFAGDLFLGRNDDEVLEFLVSPKNNETYVRLKEDLSAKIKI